ncbi:MAG TPA: serine/threonine-protein kinase [Gemmatimonadales bacterium]|nr:serine/threonine-protein kinase [Gemmatimonadales bacterium]
MGPRYEIVGPLGKGGFARTFLARDLERGRDVALKTLYGSSMADAKAYQLFEREAAVLLGLRHRGVPEFVEFFRADLPGATAGVLVMEHVAGESLARSIETGRSFAPLQVLDLMLELLGILDFLHTRVPPILHRDIKPANIIVRPDGGPVLVDFGAVRREFRGPEDGGSTVVGTYGYMPYEQFMGQASPASDLYALGATFLHLVTGRPPAAFMTDGGLDVPAALPVGDRLRGVIARLLEPAPARRFPSARAAREALFSSAVALAPAPSTLLADLGPPGRDVRAGAPAGALLRRLAYSSWRLMNSTVPTDDRVDLMTVLLTMFFSVVTAGVLPVNFLWIARARRKRLIPFLRDGLPARGEVTDFKEDMIGFGEKLIRVRYDFEADGRSHRGSDQVHPTIAERMRAGDQIEVLYLPGRNYDSVIVSGH